MHQQHTTNTFTFITVRIINIRTGNQFTRINTDKHQVSNKWVICNFKCQCTEWFFCIRFTFISCFTIHFCTLNRRNVQWAWQIVNNRIQQWLNTLVFKCSTTQYWVKVLCNCTLANQFFNCCCIWNITFHVCFHDFIVQCNNFFNQFFV